MGGEIMEYITVRQAAKKWNMSIRSVQELCRSGRVEGAQKFSGNWAIPVDAPKPAIFTPPKPSPAVKSPLRETPSPTVSTAHFFLMPLMNTPFAPGHCMEYISSMEKGPQKEIALAEYYYFSGQPEKAAQKAELFLTSPNMSLRLSACLIYAYANLSIGQIYQARMALAELQNTLISNQEQSPHLRAAAAFVAAAGAVLLHLPLPEGLPPADAFLPLLPPGLRAFALYVQAHYAYLQQSYEKSIGIVEATLAMGAERYPISAIYLHLVAVMDYMSLRQSEKARAHLLAAWSLAQPDDLIEGFGEHHGLLGGMLEAVLKPQWPEDFKRIIAITYRFSAGWRKVHNPDTGHDVADNLTTTEFATCMLAARGWTNQEIGEHLQISPNTVKRYISTALTKLHISHRRDLKKFMLQ